jgi:hypothetical protein
MERRGCSVFLPVGGMLCAERSWEGGWRYQGMPAAMPTFCSGVPYVTTMPLACPSWCSVTCLFLYLFLLSYNEKQCFWEDVFGGWVVFLCR